MIRAPLDLIRCDLRCASALINPHHQRSHFDQQRTSSVISDVQWDQADRQSHHSVEEPCQTRDSSSLDQLCARVIKSRKNYGKSHFPTLAGWRAPRIINLWSISLLQMHQLLCHNQLYKPRYQLLSIKLLSQFSIQCRKVHFSWLLTPYLQIFETSAELDHNRCLHAFPWRNSSRTVFTTSRPFSPSLIISFKIWGNWSLSSTANKMPSKRAISPPKKKKYHVNL